MITAQYNAKKTTLGKTKIDKMQQNYKCMLCGDGDETIKHAINKLIHPNIV